MTGDVLGPPPILIFGSSGSGVSTLVNALLGRRVMPTSNTPTTRVPVVVRNRPPATGAALLHVPATTDRTQPGVGYTVAWGQDICRRLREVNDAWGAAPPAARPKRGAFLTVDADLPWLGAHALVELPAPDHAEDRTWMGTAPSIGDHLALVLVVDGSMPGTMGEALVKRRAREINGDRPLFVAVNRCDQRRDGDGPLEWLHEHALAGLAESGATTLVVATMARAAVVAQRWLHEPDPDGTLTTELLAEAYPHGGAPDSIDLHALATAVYARSGLGTLRTALHELVGRQTPAGSRRKVVRR